MGLLCCVAVIASSLHAEAPAGDRFSITSFEVINLTEAPRPKTGQEAESANGILSEVGARLALRARFRVEDRQTARKMPPELGRVGLFLRRGPEAIASVQRGTLESCDSGFCSAVFAINASLSFFEQERSNKDTWFIQLLQNPVLEERLLEVESGKESFSWGTLSFGVSWGPHGTSISEESTSYFNSAKTSQRLSWGRFWNIGAEFNAWDLRYMSSDIALGTQGFFEDRFQSRIVESRYSLGYGVLLNKSLFLGAGAEYLQRTFSSADDEEGILPSEYRSVALLVYGKYEIPKVLLATRSGRFALDAGVSRVDLLQGLWGSARDTGSFKRGDSGSFRVTSFRFQHEFETRATRWWFNRYLVGVGFEYEINKGAFSGDPEGDYPSMPIGTSYTAKGLSWKLHIGRSFRLL